MPRYSVAAAGSQSSASGVGFATLDATSTTSRLSAASRIASSTSSTCAATSPDARTGSPPRMLRARSSTPDPRPYVDPTAVSVSGPSCPKRHSWLSPSNVFGSGSTMVPSLPEISTKPMRGSAFWKLNVDCADCPPRTR
ncbi:hypothetical protein BC477_07130 [Clavibacter michiganensis subsp. michiganensis]|uniref:Uncharacterized protein n=1 Tax=Clavibacter michiganensis subsp. michiganensis TaxID=33013 RepID=A0A251XM64_CLAMM|nr:hypothetical protein BC477_07130 [Clavibacter michiganensis subsp. michiganensis]OUE04490.1 hypothetical protein CMMCAS07_06060 [Clavibacter michiganensis subsp. michiganensis]